MGEMSGLLLFDHGPGVETLGYYYSSLRDEGVRSFVVLAAPEWLGIRGRSAEGA
jgi:hypothetical protein